MPRVQLLVNGAPVEDWLADALIEFPDAEFRVLATQPMNDGLLEIVEVTTPNGDVLVHYFADAPEVRSFKMINIGEEMVLIQFKIPISEII